MPLHGFVAGPANHVMTEKPQKMPLARQGIYLLPNLFTLAALFAGFYAVVQGMNNQFETAAVAIFIAIGGNNCGVTGFGHRQKVVRTACGE